MVDTTRSTSLDGPAPRRAAADAPYDKRKLTYATTFANPWKRGTIRAVEWMTGKVPLLRLVRRFERMGPAEGQAFWGQALDLMRIELRTPPDQIARIPRTGPLVVVANHPHGLVDGMVLAELIGRVRTDYRILTRNLLTGVREVEEFMIPVPFQHEPDARERNLEMRSAAMRHLGRGGVIVLFPSGVVAASRTMFGRAVEADWNPFTARLIRRSGASVVPVRFTGQNSRAYQIANRLSPTLRQGLLIHEVIQSCGRPQAPMVGMAITARQIREQGSGPREMAAWLRQRTLALKA